MRCLEYVIYVTETRFPVLTDYVSFRLSLASTKLGPINKLLRFRIVGYTPPSEPFRINLLRLTVTGFLKVTRHGQNPLEPNCSCCNTLISFFSRSSSESACFGFVVQYNSFIIRDSFCPYDLSCFVFAYLLCFVLIHFSLCC
jgi:hypothetical protein